MRIEIAIFDGFDELDAIGPLEVLSLAAGRGASFEVALVGADGPGEVTGNHGTRIVVSAGLAEGVTGSLTSVDEGTREGLAVIVPGGGWLDRSPAGAWAQAQRGVLPARLAELAPSLNWIASVCTGALLLASAGLLDGRPASTNQGAREELAATGARVLPNRVVDDGTVITSGGITAGLDLALWIIEREAGRELALSVADGLEYTPRNDVWQGVTLQGDAAI